MAGTVLHGGPYNVSETARHPFLKDEDRWIAACLKAGLPMLGICQGAQQIAFHLGADCGPKPGHPHEFGYYRVDPVPGASDFLDRPRWFCQAHHHMFDIPAGAQRLAQSAAFENQAFRYGRKVYGLQFHPEVTIEGFRRWQAADWAMFGRNGAQDRHEQDALMIRHDRAQADWFAALLEGLFGPAADR
ncbi:glutamine amidotransferase-related protein [Minwuia sp.]|uniref:glutamine amidotransferase-related protein n=1 Tax=Minwuia sp. TaxID=2493630 RepID=UPI003A948D9E